MRIDLLKKEWCLAAHPNLFVFTCMGPLVLVPAYPLVMIWLFSCLGIFISFTYNRETNDLYYTALLPIPRQALVTSKFLVTVTAQLASLLLTLPFAQLRQALPLAGNPVGLSANVTLFTVVFLIFGVFNFTFLPAYFRQPAKVGQAFLKCLPGLLLVAGGAEALPHFPGYHWLTTFGAGQTKLLPGLLLALLGYLVATGLAARHAHRNFAHVDL